MVVRMPKRAAELRVIEVKRLATPGRHSVGGVNHGATRENMYADAFAFIK